MTHQVKNRFQSLPFKRNLQRYTSERYTADKGIDGVADSAGDAVGLCRLNPVYPLPITYSLSNP
jgi:hypothetical protein